MTMPAASEAASVRDLMILVVCILSFLSSVLFRSRIPFPVRKCFDLCFDLCIDLPMARIYVSRDEPGLNETL